MTLRNFRQEFPLLETCIYADTAANGLLSKKAVDWRRSHDQNFIRGGEAMKLEAADIFMETKNSISQVFTCPVDCISLVQNFSVGFNFILEGIAAESKVILVKDEYPSVSWPFRSRGFNCHIIPITAELEEDIMMEVRKSKADIIALSMVQYLNGVILQPSFFQKLKKEFPQLLILVDATQYCGAFPLNFEDSGIDILGCSGYKWLLSGFGNGFFLFQEDILEQLQLKVTGFHAARGDVSKELSIPAPQLLEPGHLDQLSFGTLSTSLKMLMEVGLDEIGKQNSKLSDSLKEELAALNLLELHIVNREHHSTIFSIPLSDKTWRHLQENNIVCSQRGGRIRISLHAYNTVEEVHQIARVLKNSC